MKPIRLEPVAPVLLESMRAIGYLPETAVADLIDNSITAGARTVHLRFPAGMPDHFAILDDGTGMTERELATAMRHGSRSPNEARSEGDLGRFGLGLKTASMSQCRRLTVATIGAEGLHAIQWDLDEVARRGDWIADRLDPADLDGLPHVDALRAQGRGTLVVWQKLDRLAAGDPGNGTLVSERLALIREHLALVFHRFLSGESRSQRLSILVNANPITPQDPFLEQLAPQTTPEERILIHGHAVTVRAYTLPHISKLSRAQIEAAGGEGGLRRKQGFYVYRNRRLIVWGTWFRLFRQEELTKLTRIRVDLPNALDHLWTLDIKKSAAEPPAVIRDRLRHLIPTLVKPSQAAIAYRGRVTQVKGIQPVWRRVEDREGGVRYEVDAEHPVVAALVADLGESGPPAVGSLLRVIAASLPVEALYNDRAAERMGHKMPAEQEKELAEELEALAHQILATAPPGTEGFTRLRNLLPTLEPFALHPRITDRILTRLTQ